MYLPIDKNIVKSTIKKHPPESDKTTVGALLSICGSYGIAKLLGSLVHEVLCKFAAVVRCVDCCK